MDPSTPVERETIAARLDAGRTLDDVERELLEPAALTDEQRAVLWLYACGRHAGENSDGERFVRPPQPRR
jgi:hypothetical protein